ncbi:hypothetical protein Slin15195_G105530 [Septoria linicola]|uniref:Uncharacterized protein n=1 Tax=Septoria linicola TaxID=215465 RepID=A0A9Q9AY55_9PEZI|nr:hypothetical protein Slin15195_G105530 [Septoria linicola]
MKLNIGRNACIAATILSYLSGFALGHPLRPDARRDDQAIDTTEGLATGPSNNRYHEIQHIPLQDTLVAASFDRELESRGLPKLPKVVGRPPPPPPLPAPRPGAAAPAAGIRPPGVSGPSTGSAAGSRPAPGVAPPREPTSPRADPPSPKPDWQPIPLDKVPGNGGGVGNEPKAMTDYETLGRKQLDEYEAKAKSDSPDVALVKTEAELAQHPKDQAFLDVREVSGYKVDEQVIHTNDPALKALKNFGSSDVGFSLKDSPSMTRQVVVTNKESGEMINRGTYDTDGKFIVYQDAFKDAQKDVNPKIPLNEIGVQNFKNAAGDKAKNLKAVYLTDVQNKELWGIVRQNYDDVKQPFEQVLTFQRGTPQFDRIMGSPNFSSKFYSFGNHHNALGNKVPDKVVVAPKQAPEGTGGLTLAVVFK